MRMVISLGHLKPFKYHHFLDEQIWPAKNISISVNLSDIRRVSRGLRHFSTVHADACVVKLTNLLWLCGTIHVLKPLQSCDKVFL
jgi:hypothetical protein